MKKYIALFLAIVAITAYAGEKEYKGCLKRCVKTMTTPEDKEKCPAICEPLREDD